MKRFQQENFHLANEFTIEKMTRRRTLCLFRATAFLSVSFWYDRKLVKLHNANEAKPQISISK